MTDVASLVERVRRVVQPTDDRAGGADDRAGDFVPLHAPEFGGNDWAYVKDCLDTGWVSSVGAYVDRFEEDLARFTGVERAVVTVNGTAALHVALRLVGVQEGDEVIVPALTFIATANAVAYCGAIPHFADSEASTLGLDPDALRTHLGTIAEVRGGVTTNRETGQPIRAVVVMHAFGHPARLDELVQVCDEFSLALVEDAAESLGSYYKGRHTGGIGQVGTLSFNGNKVLTTGGGGALLTNSHALADEAKHLTTTAKKRHRWAYEHDQIGFNYRMPNLNAALGCAQLERLPSLLERKRALAAAYAQAFAEVEEVAFVAEPPGTHSNYWLCALMLKDEAMREAFLEATNAQGLMTRPVWALLCDAPMYAAAPRADLSGARAIAGRLVNVPSSAVLGGAYV